MNAVATRTEPKFKVGDLVIPKRKSAEWQRRHVSAVRWDEQTGEWIVATRRMAAEGTHEGWCIDEPTEQPESMLNMVAAGTEADAQRVLAKVAARDAWQAEQRRRADAAMARLRQQQAAPTAPTAPATMPQQIEMVCREVNGLKFFTAADLIRALQQVPAGTIICQSSDEEGNSIHPIGFMEISAKEHFNEINADRPMLILYPQEAISIKGMEW